MKKHAYFIHYYFLESTLLSDDRRTPHGNTYNDKVAGVTRKFCIECIFESLYSLKVAETMNQSRIFFYSAFTELEQSTDTPQINTKPILATSVCVLVLNYEPVSSIFNYPMP